MNKQNYPERIYCTVTWSPNSRQASPKCCGTFNTKAIPHGLADNVEYIKANLMPKWHDVRKKLPPLAADGRSERVNVLDSSGEYGVAWYDKLDGWCSTDDSLLLISIVAWCPIPKRNANNE